MLRIHLLVNGSNPNGRRRRPSAKTKVRKTLDATEVAEMSLAHQVGSDVECAYARSDLLEKLLLLIELFTGFISPAFL
jgi:hypothetical protein